MIDSFNIFYSLMFIMLTSCCFSGSVDNVLNIKDVDAEDVWLKEVENREPVILRSREDGIGYEDYRLIVKTDYLDDSLDVRSIYFPAILNQSLMFFKGDTLLKEVPLDLKQENLKLTKNGDYLLRSYYVNQLVVLKKKDSFVFVVKGVGLCQHCSEYVGYFTKEGEVLFFYYGDKQETIDSFGDFEKLNLKGERLKSVKIDYRSII